MLSSVARPRRCERKTKPHTFPHRFAVFFPHMVLPHASRSGVHAGAGQPRGDDRKVLPIRKRHVVPALVVALPLVAPYLVKPGVTILSLFHPTVAISIEHADVGWLQPKPRLQGVTVRSKDNGLKTVFAAEAIRADRPVLKTVLARDQKCNIFIDRPIVAAYNLSSSIETTTSPFSAEVAVDDRLHLFVSDGTLLIDRALQKMLNGRLFVDVTRTLGDVRLEMDAPGVSVSNGCFRIRGSDVAFLTPMNIRTYVNQAFVSSFLGTINPLLSNAIAVDSGQAVSMRVAPVGEVMHLKPNQQSSLRIDVDAYTLKIRPGAVIGDLLKTLKVADRGELLVESSQAVVIINSDSERTIAVDTTVENVSLKLSDALSVDARLRSRIDGLERGDDAALEATIEIQPQTLRNVLRIKTETPLELTCRGTVSTPRLLVRDAAVRLGILLLEGYVR